MQQDASSRSVIEEYESQLMRDPDSYVFARLSQAYLAAGQLENALHTASQGVIRHPRYVAGQRALAFACHAKGMEDQCRQALEAVTAALPEELESQKMLAKLLVSAGQVGQAMTVLRTVLDFYPDDEACRVELKLLEAGTRTSPDYSHSMDSDFGTFQDDSDDEEIIEDLEILEMDESDVLEDDESGDLEDSSLPSHVHHDPLSTATLAELYVQQGYYDKALSIYRAMSATDRASAHIKERIEELEAREFSLSSGATGGVPPTEELEENVFSVPGAEETALASLEGWLENVRRVKACR